MEYFLVTPSNVIALALDKHFFFGRAEGNNIVVDDPRASRRHAELYWDGTAFILLDLSSSNGTTVNGERIVSALLVDGDEIAIGLQSYTFRAVEDRSELNETIRKITRDSRHMQTAEMPSLGSVLPNTDFNGVLGAMSVTEICQMLQLGGRDGMLVIVAEGGEKAFLYFERGRIVGAVTGPVEGDDAVYKALKFRKGTFNFQRTCPELKKNVKRETTAILLEAARRNDEGGGSGRAGPPPLMPSSSG